MIVRTGSVIVGYLDHAKLGNSEWVTRPIVPVYYEGRKMRVCQLLLASCGLQRGAMTLTTGTGPFGDQGDKTFNFEVQAPRDHVLFFEDSPHRVRVMFGGETVADSRRVKLMHEQGHLPVYYFPRGDMRMDLLEATNHTTHCPFKGDASYWSVRVGVRVRAFSLHVFSVLFSYVLILLLPVLLWPRACLVRDRLTPLG